MKTDEKKILNMEVSKEQRKIRKENKKKKEKKMKKKESICRKLIGRKILRKSINK